MQTPDNQNHEQDEALQAPPRLVAALKCSGPARVFIPPTIDEAILRASRHHLGEKSQSQRNWFRFAPWFAGATAAILLLATASTLLRKGGSAANFVREDINHDGQVDILDAFALARQLRDGATTSQQQDFNSDGVVDERDVATVAAHAVSLEKRGRS